MTLVFGGAYQGKQEWAWDRFGVGYDDSFYCDEHDPVIDFDKDLICGLHLFILAAVRRDMDPVDYLAVNLDRLAGKVVLCDDITCGVVPTDPVFRAWREAVGRCLAMLSRRADTVVRVFCGIGVEIKSAKEPM